MCMVGEGERERECVCVCCGGGIELCVIRVVQRVCGDLLVCCRGGREIVCGG